MMCFPTFDFADAIPLIAQLSASVPQPVKKISRALAPIAAATCSLDFSTASFASRPILYMEDGLP